MREGNVFTTVCSRGGLFSRYKTEGNPGQDQGVPPDRTGGGGSPPPSELRGTPWIDVPCGRYASSVHAGALSCLF